MWNLVNSFLKGRAMVQECIWTAGTLRSQYSFKMATHYALNLSHAMRQSTVMIAVHTVHLGWGQRPQEWKTQKTIAQQMKVTMQNITPCIRQVTGSQLLFA